ncbi:tRNA uridine-5-carboxymethylaminomethyl(34) synthesis GTPase MnmE [Pelagerythrobacter sp.]|uniref:tRNA uridine-5-carboxymethylaminomethyl(34) synthesis GTPase MnmE n=1 Tax=Pelagerythrobacter sp. TaxID=2800702 RepID=UPI0035B398EB
MAHDTIFALSSGAPPAGIAVVRVSGPAAGDALCALAGGLPESRRAVARTLRDESGEELDRALMLWLPGPGTATGEDIAELHLHGGRAVVASVERALDALPGLRAAAPGEFTRRAFANGRIDLAEAEGLAELLEAETEFQRRSALALAGGALSKQAAAWRDAVLGLSAEVEAMLDFSDEEDAAELPSAFSVRVATLADDLRAWLDRPRAMMLREGYRIVLAGPPNAGKSTLFNALLESEAAITSPIAGTTRDVLERSVAMAGIPFTFVDTAGLRDSAIEDDAIEAIGIARAREQLDRADCVLWLGEEGQGPAGAWEIDAKADDAARQAKGKDAIRLSARTGLGMDVLRARLVSHARDAMPAPGEVALNDRQSSLLAEAATALAGTSGESDPLILAERLRLARSAFDRLLGRASTEDMLDALFGRFCIGK